MSAVAAAVIAGGAVVAAGVSAYGANQAAQTQAGAAQNAQNIQQGMFNTTLANEAPFLQAGQQATGQLNYLLGIGSPNNTTGATGAFGSLNAPFTSDMMKQYSPAYQFQMQQGQQGVLNQDAGGAGALSGAALKDLTSFNQNYANTAFNNAFNQYNTQQTNTFNRLASIAQMGQGAASNQATGGSNFASSIGNSATNVGTALAGGQVGVANAISGGVSSAAPWLGMYNSGSPSSTAITFNPNAAQDAWSEANAPIPGAP